jgi:hypothetical protein
MLQLMVVTIIINSFIEKAFLYNYTTSYIELKGENILLCTHNKNSLKNKTPFINQQPIH